MKALNLEREFEPQHRSPLTKTMIDNQHNERNSVIEYWHINNSRKNDREPKAIAIIYKDNMKDLETLKSTDKKFEEKNDIGRQKRNKDSLIETSDERSNSTLKLANLKEKLSKNLDIEEEIEKERDKKEKYKGDSLVNKGWKTSNNSSKEVVEKQNNKEEASSIQIICKKLEIERDIKKEKELTKEEIDKEKLKLREIVNKGWENNNNDNLKEKIYERIKSIERSIIYIQNDSLAELTKKLEILNTPLDIDRKRNITVLNTTESSDNQKNNRHTICHKYKKTWAY